MTLQSVVAAQTALEGERACSGLVLAPAEALRLPLAGPLLVATTMPLSADLHRALLAALRARRPDMDGVGSSGSASVLAACGANLARRALARGAPVVRAHLARGRVFLGAPTSPATLASIPCEHARDAYLGWQARALLARSTGLSRVATHDDLVPVAPRGDPDAVRREIDALRPADRLYENERWIVARARGEAIPALLHEIGRAREESFRAAGEGTGESLDLDRFDPAYWHLVAWNRRDGELAGAYRLADTSTALASAGTAGLYTSTLFDYRNEFFARLGAALELGRAFVRPKYQRSLALALLWRGLARWVWSEGSRTLFGAVSLSSEYSPFSRALIAAALLRHRSHPRLAGLAAPRNAVPAIEALRRDASLDCFRDPALLSAVVAEAESDGKPLPVLLREYLKLGGRFAAWSVDRDFADSLDGLVVVELGGRDDSALARWAAER